jgi:L-ascorbate metabolism protein UlaG (beta-lactamase superfamily)
MKLPCRTFFAMSAFAASAMAASGTAPYATDTFRAPDGQTVTFTCIKHGSLRIQYNGLEIQVDPVGKGLPPATDYAAFPKADLILVTHEHFDHFDRDAIATLCKDGTETIVNPAVRGMLGSGRAMSNGDRFDWRDGISIAAVPAYNTTPGHLQFHPKGRDNGYVLDLGGFRVYIAGDTEDIPEMASLSGIDVAFLPCNQPYTMTPEQAASAARAFTPKVLFPYHYGTTDIQRLAELLKGSNIDVRIRDYQ